MGDGALELTVEDARDYLLIPDSRQFDRVACQSISDAFRSLLSRPIGSIIDEIKCADRQALDAAVLGAMGLEPSHWLPRFYDGLTTLLRERMQLGQMRGKARRNRPRQAVGRVSQDVLQELLPSGPACFPDDFLSPTACKGLFRQMPLPQSPLRYVGPYFGRHNLSTEDGQTITVDNRFEVQFLLFAQASGQQIARLPEKPVELTRTVNNYLQYLRDLQQRLFDTFFTRTLDQAAAERFVQEIWRRFNLPQVKE